jgi:peptidoglycan/LPS O-acetylase OafA/YrhL
VGQLPFGPDDDLNLLFDKWRLGPLRLINLFALLVLTLQFGPWLKSLRRWRFLETLGAASLPVFCAHLVIVLLALALATDPAESSIWMDLALIGGSFTVLYVVARIARPLQLPPPEPLRQKSSAVTAHEVR